ncbi:hypothetical protein NF212_10910 [Parasalinivibrio latis]|uniref:DUF6920 family protein n=1 Tax=Parasalinivibrio latis TaxID=2952610 RepID=UPI0030E26470
MELVSYYHKGTAGKAIYWLLGFITIFAGTVMLFTYNTEADISRHTDYVLSVSEQLPATQYDPEKFDALPAPVQRYFHFTFIEPAKRFNAVEMTMEGDFRRPQQSTFAFTTAEQTAAVNSPAFVFSATTPIIPGIWARAYDAFYNGEMEMKAKILSTLTVVDERETPELNRISLRRWLLEAPLYPSALLPVGLVTWEAIDEYHARATVNHDGMSASMVAKFREDGSLESFAAEKDGDLNTPYHGSGEHVLREDYRLVNGMMIPHRFVISRAADGKVYPFWKGEVSAISFK